MEVLHITALTPGRITAEPVCTANGQIIIKKGTVLTQKLLIHMKFYGITSIAVEANLDVPSPKEATRISDKPVPLIDSVESPLPKGNVSNPTNFQKLSRSPEFLQFQIQYTHCNERVKSAFERILANKGETVTDLLFDSIHELMHSAINSIELFDRLHNMRANDDSIYSHCINVSLIAGVFGRWLQLPIEEIKTLMLCGLFHDIGKTQIPERILNKKGTYSQQEFEIVKLHPILGHEVLSKCTHFHPEILDCALMHHERCDKSGYPNGLGPHEVSNFSKIIAIADVYDAMTAARPHRAPMCPFEVISSFEKDGYQKFDTKYLLVFLEHIAYTYQNNRVLLSDGQGANIVILNKQHLSKPVVQLADGSCIDLSTDPNLHILSLL